VLEIKNIDVFYGDVQVVWDVSFEVKKGEVVALIGANGAGKSTTLKTVSGILRPRKGDILFDGTAIHKIEAYRLVEMGIALCPEARRLFVEMTVEENLEMGSLKGEAKKQREKTKEMVFALFPRLKERRRQLAGTLSGGEQQMVAIGRGLMSLPKLMMFDEPSLGLAPILVFRPRPHPGPRDLRCDKEDTRGGDHGADRGAEREADPRYCRPGICARDREGDARRDRHGIAER